MVTAFAVRSNRTPKRKMSLLDIFLGGLPDLLTGQNNEPARVDRISIRDIPYEDFVILKVGPNAWLMLLKDTQVELEVEPGRNEKVWVWDIFPYPDYYASIDVPVFKFDFYGKGKGKEVHDAISTYSAIFTPEGIIEIHSMLGYHVVDVSADPEGITKVLERIAYRYFGLENVSPKDFLDYLSEYFGHKYRDVFESLKRKLESQRTNSEMTY